jgi:preprotein translocase subunit YajC
MTGLIAFILFWIVFGFFYLRRDKSKDEENTAHFHRH